MNLILSVLLWSWSCTCVWPPGTWVTTRSRLCHLSVSASGNLHVEGWCATTSFWDVLCQLLLGCLSCDHRLVLMCERSRFLLHSWGVWSSALPVLPRTYTLNTTYSVIWFFFRLLHSVLQSVIFIFQRHKWTFKRHACTLTGVQVLLSVVIHPHVRPKEGIFRHSDCEKWNRHPLTPALGWVVELQS